MPRCVATLISRRLSSEQSWQACRRQLGLSSITVVPAISLINPIFEEVFVCGYLIHALEPRHGPYSCGEWKRGDPHVVSPVPGAGRHHQYRDDWADPGLVGGPTRAAVAGDLGAWRGWICWG